ncbi:MAG TPA: DUF882 domain-containing protein [Syntrophales bacterium]|nr:DUF882 domain-containing protein [Syntrophales bacterium]
MYSFRKHSDLLCQPFSRRFFLKLGVFGAAFLTLPHKAFAALEEAPAPELITPGWREEADLILEPTEERRLHLYSTNTGDTFNRVYWADGEYIPEALEEVNFLMRDYRANLIKEIDPNLLDLLHNLNQKLECDRPYYVISGYRSPKTNAALRKRNRSVARNSLHMSGMAVDLRVPDLNVKHLCNAALEMHCGGVGYYARRGFVHLDVGDVRTWRDSRKKKPKAKGKKKA